MYSDYGIQRTRNTVAKKSWPKRMLWLVIFGFAVLTWFTLEYTYDSTEPLISFTAGSVTNSNTEEIPTLFTSKNTKEKTVITPHVKPSAPKQTVIVEDREEVSPLINETIQDDVKLTDTTSQNTSTLIPSAISERTSIEDTGTTTPVTPNTKQIKGEDELKSTSTFLPTTSNTEPKETNNENTSTTVSISENTKPVDTDTQTIFSSSDEPSVSTSSNTEEITDGMEATKELESSKPETLLVDDTKLPENPESTEGKLLKDIANNVSNNSHILKGISFKTGATTLTNNSQEQINSLAKILKQHPEKIILIRGHTDNIGKRRSNRYISLHRALSVKNALIQQGIPKTQVKVKAMGEKDPLVANTSKKNRQVNRRIDISILP